VKKQTTIIKLIFMLIISPLFLPANDIPEIDITNEFKSKSIGSEIQIFQDLNSTLSIHDILSNDFKGEFKNISKQFHHFGFTRSTVWVKFILKKNADVESRSPLVIVNEFPMIDHSHFYQINNNSVPEKIVETGIMHPLNSRDHIYYKIVFLANIPPGESRIFYLSFKSDFLLSLNLRILSMTEFMKNSSVKITFIGIYIGIFLFLAGYHLFLFFINWEYISLYFSLTIMSMLLFALSYTGFAGLYLWPEVFWIKKYSIYIFGSLIQVFLLFFTTSLYKLKEKKLSFYKFSRLTIVSLIVFTVLLVATSSDLALSIVKGIIFITFFSLPAIVLALKRESEQKPFLFIVGILIFNTSIIIYCFSRISILNLNMLAEYALRIGPGIFIILTSLFLAERTKALKKEKNKFEIDLKNSRQRFRSLVESSYDIIWETDKKGLFTYISPNIKDIVGFEPSYLVGKGLNDIFIFEADENINNPFADKKNIKKPIIGLINSILDPHDKKVTFETNALPFFNNDGNFQGYRGINREITERLRTEKIQEIIFNISNSVITSLNIDEFYEIIHSELNKIVDATNFFVGIYEKDTDSIILPYLKDEKDNYEKTAAEGTISALVIKENKSLLLKPSDIIKLESEGKIGIVGTPSKVWLGVPLKIDKDVIGVLVLQSYDDENAYSESDLKLMEFISGQIAISISKKQVEERTHILAQSVEQSPALVIITDLNGSIEYVNSKFEKTTGYSMEEMIGCNPGELKSGKIQKSVYENLWNSLKQGKEWRGEFHNRKKNGDFYWELAFITPIKNELGIISHYLAIKEDITERKELELQLMQSQKMESVGTLAGGISHDFNNILTVINGYSDLALMRLKKTDPMFEEISTIKKAGKRGEKLTRQIMAFSRKQIFHSLVININEIIEGLENMLKSLIEEDFAISFDLCPDLPLIKADPGQIEQILINLLVNARDAINLKTERADEKKIIVKTGIKFIDDDFIKKHITVSPGPHVIISVEDNGIGMTEDVRHNIFEPFFTTKVRGKGTGMGLATVYGIVKQNNSSILVFSSPGEGTTFQILWPVTEEKLSDIDSKEIDDSDLYGDELILFVEDDKHVNDFAVLALKDFGYKVHSSSNGKHALEYVKKKKLEFDILITDLVMPDMNGKELSEKIVKIYPDIKILFTSGYTENHLVKSGELQNDINFLPKPYTAKSLLTFIRKILKSEE